MRCLPQLLPILVFETGSLTDLARLSGFLPVYFLSAGVTGACGHTWLLHRCWGSRLMPDAFTAGTKLTAPSPWFLSVDISIP